MTGRRGLPVLLALLLGAALPACGPVSVNTIAVSPDGKLAFAVDPKLKYSFLTDAPRCDIILSDTSGNQVKRITANGRHNSWATFSPDGKTLLCVECTVVEEKKETKILFPKLVLYDVATGERRLLRGDKDYDSLLFPQFSPDGTKVAYMTQKHLKVLRVPDGALVASWPRGLDSGEAPGVLGFRWVANDGLFVVWGKEELASGDIFAATVGTVTVTPGERAKLPAWRGKPVEAVTWCIPSITARRGTAVVSLFDVKLPAEEEDITRAPLGLWVYSNGSLRKLTRDNRRYYFAEISPDGRRLAAISTPVPTQGEEADADFIPASGELVLVDVATGEVEAVSKGACAHPFWIDDDRLGFVSGDLTTETTGIVVLDLRDKKRLNLTKALAPRLKALFARERARQQADQGGRP